MKVPVLDLHVQTCAAFSSAVRSLQNTKRNPCTALFNADHFHGTTAVRLDWRCFDRSEASEGVKA